MAHHKRKRAKHQRSGCLLCKPWKDDRGKNGNKGLAGPKRDFGPGVPTPAEFEAERRAEADQQAWEDLEREVDRYDDDGYGDYLDWLDRETETQGERDYQDWLDDIERERQDADEAFLNSLFEDDHE